MKPTTCLKRILFAVLFIAFQQISAQPIITGVSPLSGNIGATITITGSGFSATVANNIVYFGAVKATVNTASVSSLTVTVPDGASYTPISVTTNSLTGYAANAFLPTFTGGAVFTGTPLKTFAFSPKIAVKAQLAADLDGDGKTDLLVLSQGTGSKDSVTFLQNTGTAGNLSLSIGNHLGLRGHGSTMALADINGDGKPDLLVADYNLNTVYVYRNTSVGSNITFDTATTLPAGINPSGIATGDFDGDGKPDIAICNYASNTLSVFKNTTTGIVPTFATKTDFAVSPFPVCITTADIDGDGIPEIAVGSATASSVDIFKSSGTIAGITQATSITGLTQGSTSAGISKVKKIVAVDLDGDKKPELVIMKDSSTISFICQNTGTGGILNFPAAIEFEPNDIFTATTDLIASDLDGDGRPDLVFAVGDSVYVSKNTAPVGSISLAPPVAYAANHSPAALVSGDFDGDGKTDIAGSNFSTPSIFILENQPATGGMPKIKSFYPDSAVAGETVAIYGSNFGGIAAVSFGNTAARSFSSISDTAIYAVVGAGATGKVKVVTQSGSDSLAGFVFLPDSLKPVIGSFSPNSGTSGTVVSITGHHFSRTTAIYFGGLPAASFSIKSDTLVQAIVGNGSSGAIVLYTPIGNDTASTFTYTQTNFPPVVKGFNPASGETGTQVSITGIHFTGATGVSFGNTNAASFSVVSDTSIIAFVATGASGSIRVTTTNGLDSLAGFSFISNTNLPTIASFSPSAGNTGTQVSITGSRFTGATAVSFGGVTASAFTVVSDSLVTAIVGNGASGYVSITTNAGKDSLGGFGFVQPSFAPQLFSFTPSSGVTGTRITILGVHLSATSELRFGGVNAASFTVMSDSVISAIVGNGASGLVWLRTTNGGQDSLPGFGFVIQSSPIITAFNPKSGPVGTVVRIDGAHFTGTTAVTFGGIPASSFSTVTDSTIYASVGNGATGFVNITSAEGTDSLGTFTVVQGISSFPNPAAGWVTINFPAVNAKTQIKLSDLSGKLIKTQDIAPGATTITLSLWNVKPGVYVITWGNASMSFKQLILVE